MRRRLLLAGLLLAVLVLLLLLPVFLSVLDTPKVARVPELTGRSIGDAETLLEKRGLRLSGVRVEPRAGERAGTVIAQEPGPDARLRQGQSVVVTIAVPTEAGP